MPGCLVDHQGRLLLYYTGWSLTRTVPFTFSIGLAQSHDGGRHFDRLSEAPVLGRNHHDPLLAGAPWVIVEDGNFRMWYVSGLRWEVDPEGKDAPVHYYTVKHATSRDGKLQVELAQLRYALPRLVEKNTMMSRLTGGIGGRGPGETKLEINRRRARERINLLEKRLEDLADDRRLRRQRRTDREIPIIAICGYTNAGKSTLLNSLTEGNALAADKLFATLDPISRRLRFPHEREVVITDTVGFIRDLPEELARAFRATLEEMADADLLVHVVDASDPDRDQQIRAVDGSLLDNLRPFLPAICLTGNTANEVVSTHFLNALVAEPTIRSA